MDRVGGSRRRILVVDDNRDHVLAMSVALRMLGYQVRSALDGLEALEAAAQFHPQTALIDLALPVIDGWELATRLRSQPRRPRLIALSGRLMSSAQRARSAAAGFDEYLTKPASLDLIRATIEHDA
jgi:CheY-like chemotaxis protein